MASAPLFRKIQLSLIVLVVTSPYVNADFFTPECTSFGVSCLDCYTQKLCLGGVIWSNTSCQGSAANNRNIYCNPSTSQCTSVAPAGCTVKRGLKCPRPNGVFPDVNNCSRYVRCEADVPTTLACPAKHVYNQGLGKCVFQLETSDCFKVDCGFMNSVSLYPGDGSLYYQCTAGVPSLLACAENFVYNVEKKSCQSVCSKAGLLANPKNCSEYISCDAAGSSKRSCAPGYGFNPVVGECQKGLESLCFEISAFNLALNNLNLLPNIVKSIIDQVRRLLLSFNIDYSFLIKLGVPANLVSAVLLTGEYFLTYRFMLPPLVLNSIIEFVFSLLPPNLQAAGNLIFSVILGKRPF